MYNIMYNSLAKKGCMMKRGYRIFITCIVSCILMTIALVISTSLLRPNPLVSSFTRDFSSWTYYTNKDLTERAVELPWQPEYKDKDTVVYLKNVLPIMAGSESIFIKSYMKDIRVFIDGEQVYNSKLDSKGRRVLSRGRGLDVIDVSRYEEAKEIIIEVSSVYPQSKGEIESIKLGGKEAHILNAIKEKGLDSILGVSIVFLGVVFISIFLSAFSASKNYLNVLGIGAFFITYGIWLICTNNIWQILYNNSTLGYILEYASFYSIPIPICVLIITTYDIKNLSLIRFIAGVFTAFLTTSLLLQLLGLVELHMLLRIYHVILIISIFIVLYSLIKDVKYKDNEYKLFTLGFFMVVIFTLIDVFCFYVVTNKEMLGFHKIGILIFMLILCTGVGRYIIKLSHEKIRSSVLLNMAYTDTTTGLYNKRAFEEEMYNINKNLKYEDNIAIIILDLDNLKLINDSDGHAEGDKMIMLSAAVIKKAYKKIGTVYRIGGDEFAVICRGKCEEDIIECNREIERIIERMNLDNSRGLSISSGFGFYNGEDDIYVVFEKADSNMYIDKRKRKSKLKNQLPLV